MDEFVPSIPAYRERRVRSVEGEAVVTRLFQVAEEVKRRLDVSGPRAADVLRQGLHCPCDVFPRLQQPHHVADEHRIVELFARCRVSAPRLLRCGACDATRRWLTLRS